MSIGREMTDLGDQLSRILWGGVILLATLVAMAGGASHWIRRRRAKKVPKLVPPVRRDLPVSGPRRR